MTTQAESSTARLRARLAERRRQWRARCRRNALIALGVAGLAYDQTRTRLNQTRAWFDQAAQRGEQMEHELRTLRDTWRDHIDDVLQRLQTRGAALRDEACAALDKLASPPPVVQEDIPVTAEPPSAPEETPGTTPRRAARRSRHADTSSF